MSWEDILKMKCIMCGAELEKVYEKRKSGKMVRVRFECPECGHKEIF